MSDITHHRCSVGRTHSRAEISRPGWYPLKAKKARNIPRQLQRGTGAWIWIQSNAGRVSLVVGPGGPSREVDPPENQHELICRDGMVPAANVTPCFQRASASAVFPTGRERVKGCAHHCGDRCWPGSMGNFQTLAEPGPGLLALVTVQAPGRPFGSELMAIQSADVWTCAAQRGFRGLVVELRHTGARHGPSMPKNLLMLSFQAAPHSPCE
ncbi:hypothetical protein SKAU_G00215340 [Synaphobranchus kaupii]|uniref:Uncharacterized protein n=1 Tax=Synaphobranchus kaupii TaxID=118154 RepID=A0A9Q1F9W9_SYNKA|nr:hypothetical protein SKAU_G00215340 [Synaphobranchus kaupii]